MWSQIICLSLAPRSSLFKILIPQGIMFQVLKPHGILSCTELQVHHMLLPISYIISLPHVIFPLFCFQRWKNCLLLCITHKTNFQLYKIYRLKLNWFFWQWIYFKFLSTQWLQVIDIVYLLTYSSGEFCMGSLFLFMKRYWESNPNSTTWWLLSE